MEDLEYSIESIEGNIYLLQILFSGREFPELMSGLPVGEIVLRLENKNSYLHLLYCNKYQNEVDILISVMKSHFKDTI